MARAAAPSRTGQLVAGLGALAVVALIGTLPVLLIWAAGNPLTGLGDWATGLSNDPGAALSQAWRTLFTRDDGDLFLQTLALVGWAAAALAAWTWITFLGSFAVELAVQARARRAGRIPRHTTPVRGMRPQQRAAAVLAAAVIGALFAPTLASASATLPPTIGQPAAAAGQHVTTEPTTSAAVNGDVVRRAPAGGQITHEVQRGEGLLDIAEQYGVSLERLAEANHGVLQPDGRTLTPASTRIYAGWTLHIPITAAADTTAVPSTAASRAAKTDGGTYTVRRGDNLSAISGRVLGDKSDYPQLVALNTDRIDDPDLIHPGQQLKLPADAEDHGKRRHATGTVALPPAPAATEQPTPAAPEQQPQPPAPTTAAPTAPAPSRTPAESPAATAPATAPTSASTPSAPAAAPAAPQDTSTDTDSGTTITAGAIAGTGVLSALLLGAVLTRRHRQRQHRRPHRRLPHPRGGTTERALRIAEQPADVDRLDAAVRGLARLLAARTGPLPDVTGAVIDGATITLLLAAPCPQPPAPWRTTADHWTLPAEADLPTSTGQLSPLPTLVTVGTRPGHAVLLDLERRGALTITGDPGHAQALARYLITELACNTWSDSADIALAGFGDDEATLLIALGPDRIRTVTSTAGTVARLHDRITTVTQSLAVTGAPDTFAGRLTDDDEAWPPQILIVNQPDDDDLTALTALTASLDSTGRSAIAVIAVNPHTPLPASTHLTVDTGGQLTISPAVSLPAPGTHQAAGLPLAELAPLAEILQRARDTDDEPVPPATEPDPWAHGTDTGGRLLDPATTGHPAPPPTPDPAPAGDTEPDRPAHPILAVPDLTATTPTTRAPAGTPRRSALDPDLDADLSAWYTPDDQRPRISILGPVDVDAPGQRPDQRSRFYAEIIVYLTARASRGAAGDQLSAAIWPDGVQSSSRRVAITHVRRWLGHTADGQDWLPEMGSDRVYRLRPGYLLDWHLFRRLRARGQSRGTDGTDDLHAALELVRGVPLDGADRAYAAGTRTPYTWVPESDIYPGHVVSAIVDTAHELAEHYLDAGDTTRARWAAGQAWLADPLRGDDGPWHVMMRIAHTEGHTAELRHLLDELLRARDADDPVDLPPTTFSWLNDLLPKEMLIGHS